MPGVAGEPLGIAAGGGALPRIVADAAIAAGWRPHVLAIADGIDENWSDVTSRRMPWGQLGNGIGWLRNAGVRFLVLCGTVTVRPDFRSIIPSFATLLIMRQIFGVIRGGDDNLLRAAAGAFEARGFEVVPVQAICPNLIAGEGRIAGPSPREGDELAIERGFAAALSLGALDIGQAVVASAERVIALEGIEGTRQMLHRVADLKRKGRIGRGERCVLVKRCKPNQDARMDLPSIGLSTVIEAAEAGVCGIAVSAGRSLVLEAETLQGMAQRHGVFVIGRSEPNLAHP